MKKALFLLTLIFSAIHIQAQEISYGLYMERVLNNLPGDQKVQAERVLEINCEHPVYARLLALYADDQEKLAMFTELLYDQALLMEGLSLADPVAFADRVSRLMAGE